MEINENLFFALLGKNLEYIGKKLLLSLGMIYCLHFLNYIVKLIQICLRSYFKLPSLKVNVFPNSLPFHCLSYVKILTIVHKVEALSAHNPIYPFFLSFSMMGVILPGRLNNRHTFRCVCIKANYIDINILQKFSATWFIYYLGDISQLHSIFFLFKITYCIVSMYQFM